MKDSVVKHQRCCVVLVTVPTWKHARGIARALLEKRLAACANIVPRLESHYWWQDTLETSKELLLVIKTTRRLLDSLAEEVRAHHPYDTPEIVALPIQAGSRRYLSWLEASVGVQDPVAGGAANGFEDSKAGSSAPAG